ncbi:hypothetical protein [Anaerococcus sp. Marseille-P3915]|uniref:hypothetical protein n=1 Tax=Anaerococcus sp. Marseille-P3915 TaxID=2057799 RepID=UPI000D0ACABC|nr:hypothetical protein [Anaerococcus sp. Marseille-P3915]
MKSEIDIFKEDLINYFSLENTNEKIQLGNSLIKTWRESKNKFEHLNTHIYLVVRDLLSVCYSQNNYSPIYDIYKIICDLPYFKDESNSNKFIIRNIVIKSLLIKYLETERSDLFQIAKKLIQENKIIKDEVFFDFINLSYFDALKNELNNFNMNIDFITSIQNNNIWTEITFILPFPLKLSEIQYKYKIDKLNVTVSTELFQSENKDKLNIKSNSGALEMKYDKYGLVTNTEVKICVNKYMSIDKQVNIFQTDEKYQISELLHEAIFILNKIIDSRRIIGDNFWLNNINMFMIKSVSARIFTPKYEIRNIPFYSGHSYQLSDSYKYNSKGEMIEINNNINLLNNKLLWKLALADSKSYLLINRLEESIIQLNISLENFFNTVVSELLKKYMDNTDYNNFINGVIDYSKSELESIIEYDQFVSLKTKNIIKELKPSIFQYIKYYYKYVPENNRIDCSKTQIISSVKKIRKYRNDIVHGNNFEPITTEHVSEAINEFENLSNKFLLSKEL